MNQFSKFYAYVMDMKLDMAIYALGILVFKMGYEFLLGNTQISSLHIIGIILLGVILSLLQHAFFPKDRELSQKALRSRTLWWAITSNAVVIPLVMLFGLFSGGAIWTAPVLIIVFELVLLAMWYGKNIAVGD